MLIRGVVDVWTVVSFFMLPIAKNTLGKSVDLLALGSDRTEYVKSSLQCIMMTKAMHLGNPPIDSVIFTAS